MTDKEFLEYYEKYEEVLENAINLSFIHLTYAEFGEIVKHYKDVFGKELRKSQLNCNSCRLKALKDFKYAEKMILLDGEPGIKDDIEDAIAKGEIEVDTGDCDHESLTNDEIQEVFDNDNKKNKK
jgi:hypothetical protein